MSHATAVIVGSGVGGLASAILLQNAGIATTVLEKNDYVGGALSLAKIGEYSFDKGATMLTLPNLLGEIFHRTGADIRDYLELVELDPQARCFFAGGVTFELRAGEEKMCEEVRRISPRDVDGFRKFSKECARFFGLAQRNYFLNEEKGFRSAFRSAQTLRSRVSRRTYNELVENHVKHPQLRRALADIGRQMGVSPLLAPALMGCLTHVQLEKGAWYPIGGLASISSALARRFQELGGKIELGRKAVRVHHDGRQIRGIESEDGTLWDAHEYVINGLEPDLAGLPRLNDEAKAIKKSSAILMSIGLKSVVPGLLHHNLFFSRSHHAEHDMIHSRALPHDDPTIYLSAPTKTDSSLAPKGRECLSILVQTPADNGKIEWAHYGERYASLVKSKLRACGFNLDAHGIVVEEVKTPEAIGNWSAPNPLRNRAKPSPFANLQFAGVAGHPGPGIPFSVMAGIRATATILKRRFSFNDIYL